MGGAIGPQPDLVAQRVRRRVMPWTQKIADDDCSSSEEVAGVAVACWSFVEAFWKQESGLWPLSTTLSEPEGLVRDMSEQPCRDSPYSRGSHASDNQV
jgi:hypothetical protein